MNPINHLQKSRDLVTPNELYEGAVQGWTRTISSPLQHRVVLIGFILQHPGHLMVTETMITAMYWIEGMSHPDLGQRLNSMSSILEPQPQGWTLATKVIITNLVMSNVDWIRPHTPKTKTDQQSTLRCLTMIITADC